VSPLWVLPLVVITLGAVALVWVARSTAEAAAELAERAAALTDLGREASALRADVDAVAARARGLEWRRRRRPAAPDEPS
jgi:hypothetical protein